MKYYRWFNQLLLKVLHTLLQVAEVNYYVRKQIFCPTVLKKNYKLNTAFFKSAKQSTKYFKHPQYFLTVEKFK